MTWQKERLTRGLVSLSTLKNSMRALVLILGSLGMIFIISETPNQTKLEGADYASSSFSTTIDNTYNVMNYAYASGDSGMRNNTVLLKDLDFSFCEEINIPGMPDTKEDDFLNQYIFSEAQCPQGICFTDEFVLITSYSSEDDCMGELMVLDRETGEYMVTLGMDENSHLGGIAFDGDNVWVCNSNEKTIERISYDFIQ